MAAAPETRSWKDLPADLLREVFCRVPCLLDRHNAFGACLHWVKARQVWRPTKEPPALPSLLFPAPNPGGSPRLVCVLSGGGVHQGHDYPTIIRRGARCFASHDGGWLFLATSNPHGHKLLNFRTGAIHGLPGDMLVDRFPSPTVVVPMTTIHAAALSAAPDGESCVALCIVATTRPRRGRYVACWRMGQQRAMEIRPPGPFTTHDFLDAEDVVYHDGAFHLLLSHSDDTWVCTPELLPDNRSTEDWENRRFFHPGRHDYDQRVRGRYLVSSRGDLLLVVRFAPRTNDPTSKFKVFRAIVRPHQMPEEAEVDPIFPVAKYPWAWSELDGLDGRILFVGCGGSRSYELNDAQGQIQYNGFKPGIYFFDDQEFYFLDVEAEQYTCRDNGRWSEADGVQDFFPRADPSWISPPAWVLP